MPITTFNISSISQLSPAGIQVLQNAARQSGEISVSVGSREYSISHVQVLDGFSVEPVRGGLLDRVFRREHRMAERAISFERRLNNGNDFFSLFNNYFRRVIDDYMEGKSNNVTLQNKINSCSFVLDSERFSYPGSSLICPITLCTPEYGVLMKNSQESKICSLYDKASLLHLVKNNAPHPLSRELITESMIMEKDKCHFDHKRDTFVVSDS
ncbi:T3SS effector NleG family protein [Escherichia albertii]|uniref:T3SS effector NleG family protein n=1 Tax=Escherichia albertii TaxID=208962 RepID=UPI000931DA43|nr:T3SS effector NleG family protein [Escherichia albertii]MCZ8856431.1 T3SS effector NleG family protein [Escherichia albertii]WDB83151.1 T3SS effector NleG family protein [Escherichia albertii]